MEGHENKEGNEDRISVNINQISDKSLRNMLIFGFTKGATKAIILSVPFSTTLIRSSAIRNLF